MLLVGLLVCATPLLILTPAYDQFIGPKYDWIAVGAGALLVLTAIRAALGEPARLRLSAASGLIATWIAWNALSLIWARSPSLAWDAARHWLTLGLAAALMLDVVGGDRRRLLWLGWGLCVSSLVTALWTLWQDFARAFWPQSVHAVSRLPDWRGHLSAGFGNTGHIADFIALTFIANLLFYLHARRAWRVALAGAALVFGAAAMTVCWSVHSNGGLILAAIVVAVALARGYGGKARGAARRLLRRRARRIAALLALFAAVEAFYLLDHPLNPHAPSIWTEAFGSERWKEGGATRVAIWRPALRLAADHRVLGAGAGNFPYVFPAIAAETLADDPKLVRYAGRYTNAAHNELLQAWGELGVVGCALLAALAGAAFWLLARRRDEGAPATVAIRLALLGFLVAFAVHAQMNFNLQLPVTSLLFLLAAALTGALRDRGERARAGLLTVENEFGPFVLEARVAGMRRVETLGVSAARPMGGAALIAVAAVVCAAMWVGAARRQAADCVYARARMAQRGAGGSAPAQAGDGAQAERLYQLALRVNPRHHDCRSAYTVFLMERGRFAEALEQLVLVMRRLDAPELYERRAICAERTGAPDQALADWLAYYRRLPYARLANPGHYERVLADARRRGLLGD